MPCLSINNRPPHRMLAGLFGAVILCWVVVAFAHLYFFGYASMDSWCYAAPAAMARVPFALTTPFLGTFERANTAWGLHWPGGLLLTSIVTPFLPHGPGTYVSIYIFYWLLAGLALAALVQRLTSSGWLALGAFLFVAGDHICFSVTWLERYECLDGAIAIAAILALCGRRGRYAGLRSVIIGLAFFLFPLLHPVFSGLGAGWVAYLGFRTFALKRPWKHFCIATVGYALGWATFCVYYRSRPWLYEEFLNHANINLELTRANAPPGLRTFFRTLLGIDYPTRAGTVIYLVGLGGTLWLLGGLWKSRRNWRDFLSREDLAIFVALGLAGTLFLSQFTYNIYYWAAPWPFAVAMTCLIAQRLLEAFPARRCLIAGVISALVLLHITYLPARTYLWYKAHFVNLRGQLGEFAATLPPGGRLFVPEVLWDYYAGGNREVYMNALPYLAGDPAEKRYASYILSLMRPGDVLVIDALQSHVPLIDPRGAGWKELGHRSVLYDAHADRPHGFDLTAFQKE